MKKKIIFFTILIFIIYILLSPEKAVKASSAGLILWYEKILPTLLPFAILSNILIYSNYLNYIAKYVSNILHPLLPVSENGSFIVLSGFLFGFPMGSKNCAELLKDGKIEKEEAKILFVITNNMSPVFINSYILFQELQLPQLFLLSLLVLYVPPLLLGNILLHHNANIDFNHKNTASRSQMNFKIIDAGIMNGFETLIRIGGYIMLFSIVISMISLLPIHEYIHLIIINALELTNGVHYLSITALPDAVKYIIAMTATAFGGFSGLAQTSSMIKGTDLSMKYYIKMKLLLTIASAMLAIIVSLIFLS